MLVLLVVGVGGRSRVVEKADPLAGAVLSPHHRDFRFLAFAFLSRGACFLLAESTNTKSRTQRTAIKWTFLTMNWRAPGMYLL